MHEISLVTSLVDHVHNVSKSHGFSHVEELHVGVGILSGIDPQCLEFCFPEVTKGSILDGARLIIDIEQLTLHCGLCDKQSITKDTSSLICTHCKSNNTKIISGNSLRIIDLQVE